MSNKIAISYKNIVNSINIIFTCVKSLLSKIFNISLNKIDRQVINNDLDSEALRQAVLKVSVNIHNMKENEKRLFMNFLNFYDIRVDDIKIPRSDIAAININTPPDQIKQIIANNTHARLLVYEDNLDNIIGFAHIKDVFNKLVKQKDINLRQIVRRHIVAAPSMKLLDFLIKMQIERIHIAVVIDEYGSTDGIVTIEDVIETIVGDIEDEYDVDKSDDNKFLEKLDEDNIIVNARISIEIIEKIFGVTMRKSQEYNTIGGLVMKNSNKIPKIGETVKIADNIYSVVLDSTPRTLKKLKITKK